MVPADATAAPTVTGRIMPRTALAALLCAQCGRWHVHLPKPGLVKGACGASYRLRIEGEVSKREAAKIRYALKTTNFKKEAPTATR